MKIAVDAMGGDFAPEEVVKGAVMAARRYGVGLILVGPEERIKKELTRYDTSGLDIEIVHTDQYLIEGEPAAYALREKRNSSILLATKLVKQGKADAVFGAGHTGGVMTAAAYVLGTMEGISRPVVGGAFLGFAPNTMLMDGGSNVDCQPHTLLDFAIVGTVYCQKMMNIANPTVAILSVGAEEGKGNAVVKAAYPLFQKSGLNFIGNVEGYDIPSGKANVIVCDGFVGNIIIKFCEAMGKVTAQWLEDKLKGKIPVDDIRKIVNELILATNAAEAHGGGPLWAVDGVACVAHGRSKAEEIARALEQAKIAVERDLVGSVKTALAAARAKLNIPAG